MSYMSNEAIARAEAIDLLAASDEEASIARTLMDATALAEDFRAGRLDREEWREPLERAALAFSSVIGRADE